MREPNDPVELARKCDMPIYLSPEQERNMKRETMESYRRIKAETMGAKVLELENDNMRLRHEAESLRDLTEAYQQRMALLEDRLKRYESVCAKVFKIANDCMLMVEIPMPAWAHAQDLARGLKEISDTLRAKETR